MLVIGHRGACGYEEENTLASFELAIQQGCKMVEFDVLRAADHQLVVHHDDSLKRMTGTDLDIGKTNLQEVQRYKTKGNQRIPSLEEALRFIAQRCEVNIELKGHETGALTAETLRELEVNLDQVLVSSFYNKELHAFNDALSGCRLAKLYRVLPASLKPKQEIPLYSIHIFHRVCNTALTKAAHKRGLKVYTFTCNTEKEWNKAQERNVDGIFTDVPDQALAFFR